MAGNDPNKSRPFGQAADRGLEAEEDPLVELARIVSEDGGFAPKVEKPKAAAPPAPPRRTAPDGLEAELLQELESSFATFVPEPPPPAREVPAAPAPRPAPVRAAPQPVARDDREADDLLRSIEEQLGQFERRQAARFASTSGSFDSAAKQEPREEPRWQEQPSAPMETPSAAAPAQESPREEWNRTLSRIRPLPDPEPEESKPEPEPTWQEPPPQPAAARSDYRFRGPANADWGRPNIESEEAEAPPPRRAFGDEPTSADIFAKHTPSRSTGIRDIFGEEQTTARAAAERETPSEEFRRDRVPPAFPEFDDLTPSAGVERASNLGGAEERSARDFRATRDVQPEFSEPAPTAGGWQGIEPSPDEPKVAATIAPSPSRRAAAARTAAAARRSRSRVIMVTLAGIVIVAVIGGAAALYLREMEQAPSGAPPVIAAPDEPVRIDAAPSEQANAESEAPGAAVYDHVAGNAPATQEQVVDSAEEPRDPRIVLPPPQTASNDSVVKPVGGEEDSTAASDSATPPADESASDEIGPRRVPTYVVRSDGTIVATDESNAVSSQGSTTQDQQIAALATEEIQPVPVPTVAIGETPANNPPPAEPAEANAAPAPVPSTETTPVPDEAEMVPRPSIEEPAGAAEPEPSPAPAPAAETNNAPVNLANAAAGEAAAPAPAPSGSGYVVQLSSQRSEDQARAAYADLQSKFGSVLASLTPQIQQADLGAKGIYYRVRVGPWESRDDAIKVCEALKAAGGDCLVTR